MAASIAALELEIEALAEAAEWASVSHEDLEGWSSESTRPTLSATITKRLSDFEKALDASAATAAKAIPSAVSGLGQKLTQVLRTRRSRSLTSWVCLVCALADRLGLSCMRIYGPKVWRRRAGCV